MMWSVGGWTLRDRYRRATHIGQVARTRRFGTGY
jgi:hypothetical protein